MRLKGSVTIFLSLALLLVTALVGSLLESARVTVSREIALDNSYLAQQNILAEYQRELWNDYHLLFVDASELNGEDGVKKLANSYLSKMMPGGRDDFIGTVADFTSMGFKENLTENGCYYFSRQVALYMKYGVAAGLGKKIINNADLLKTTEDGSEAIRKTLKIKVEAEKKLIELERKEKKLEEKAGDIKKGVDKIKNLPGIRVKAQSKSGLTGIESEKKPKKKFVKKTEKKEENDIDKEEAKKKYEECQKNLDIATKEGDAGGLLGVFLPSGKKISKLKIESTTWDEIQTGDNEHTDIIDSGLLILYAKEHFKNFLSKTKEDDKKEALKYGLEYLIVGKDSDEDNLSSIANRIFGIRTIVQYGYFLTRKDKVAEAEAIAAAISGILALPAAIEIIKTGIIMGWAIDEAGKEVKKILKGEEISLIPGKEGVKFKYENFLDSFIILSSSSLPTRMVKLIEQNMKLRYNNGFRADSMFAGIYGEVRIRTIPRIFRLALLDGISGKKFSHWESELELSQSLCRE